MTLNPSSLSTTKTDEEAPVEFETVLNFPRVAPSLHEYRQQGDKVYCIGCGIDHGKHYPPGWKLKGTDKEFGIPIMEKVW